MYLVVPCLLALLASAAGQGCSQQSSTLEHILDLITEDNDAQKDGKVTTQDVYLDLERNFDTNGDDIATEKEIVKRWSCRYGSTQYVSTYISNEITGGMESISKFAFNVPPLNTTGLTFQQFRFLQQSRFESFAARNCVDRYLTVEEKVELNAKNNDINNDSVVNGADFTADLSRYDTNSDGDVSMVEFIKGWVCYYGDDGYYARYMWKALSGGQSTISTNALANTTAIPIADFKTESRERYAAYAKEEEKSNTDCSSAGHRSDVASVLVISTGYVIVRTTTFFTQR